MDDEPQIPLARFAAFLRQHTHDVRNALNSLELENAFLKELVTDNEARDCVERVHKQLRALGGQMRSLSTLFQEPQPNAAQIPAQDLFLIWDEQRGELQQPVEIKWVNELGDEQVAVDVAMMVKVFREILANAAVFSNDGMITASAHRQGNEVIFEMREPKKAAADPSAWGDPFTTTRRGGYGLGLWSARRLLSANHGRLAQEFIPKDGVLRTRIFLPVCK